MEKCCGKVSEDSVRYNPLNDVVQCHNCGTTWVADNVGRIAHLENVCAAATAAVIWARQNDQITGMPGMNNSDLFYALVKAVDATQE